MPTDNVVPIDAEVARTIARRAIKFRLLVCALATLWLGILIPVLLFTPLPPLVPFLVLGALLVLAEHRFVLFGDETSMSGSIIVAVASVFVFAETSPFAGPMLVASLGGIYFPQVRQRQIALAVSNGAGFGLSAVAAAFAVAATGYTSSASWPMTAALIAVAVYVDWTTNSVIVGLAASVRGSNATRTAVLDQLKSDADVVLLAFAAAALGASDGDRVLTPAVLGMCLALAAFEVRLTRHRRSDAHFGRPLDHLISSSLVATSVLLVCAHPRLESLALASMAIFLAQAATPLIAMPVALSLAASTAVATAAMSLSTPLIIPAALTFAVALVVLEATSVAARAKRSGLDIGAWTTIGLLTLGPWELLRVSAAAAAVSAALSADDGFGVSVGVGLALVAVAGYAAARPGNALQRRHRPVNRG